MGAAFGRPVEDVVRVPFDGIPSAGRLVAFGLRDGWALEAARLSLEHVPTALAGRFALHRANKRGLVRIEIDITASAEGTCDRCAESCRIEVAQVTTLLYAPEESGTASFEGGELELRSEDLDIGWYIEGQVDLQDVLREAVALALPPRVACADTPSCDRRTAELLAATAAGEDPNPFAALAGLRKGTDPRSS